ncbi:cyclic lactone autoinducer peptide [Paenibacillus polymyxa]|nr:cyclic lactone autoinducer peptide [Paenibacillus polymyxa]
MKKIMMLTGSILSLLAVTVVSTASWTLIHSEEVPSELK